MGKKKSTNRRDRAAMTADVGNVFGADPHKRTVTATVLDERGGVLGTATFRVSGDGHRAMEAWALRFGATPVGGSRVPAGSAGTPPCTWPVRAMTCATSARRAPLSEVGSAAKARPPMS